MELFSRISQLFSNSSKSEQVSEKIFVRDLIDEARRAQYSENYDEALALLSRAMDIIEDNHEISTKLDISLSRADILIALEDYDTAYFILNELREDSISRKLNAPLAYSLCSLGVLEQVKGNLVEAQELFETAREKADVIKTDGASGRASAHLGDLYLLQGNASYAKYLLEDAITKLNRSGDRELLGYFLGQLGLAQIQSGQKERGEIRLQRGLDLAMNIQHQPQMRYLNNLLGQQALETGNFRQAQSNFQDAFRLYPDPPPQTAEYALLLCQLSKVNLHSDETGDALQHAKQALSIAEGISNSNLVAMAKACVGLTMRANDDESALSYLQDAVASYADIEADSFYIDALRSLAMIQIESGDVTNGIASYEEAIEKASKLPQELAEIHHELANHYTKNDEQRKAIEHRQSAIQYFGQVHQTGRVALAHCNIAIMYDHSGDGRIAQREYEKALEMLSQIDDVQTRAVILANIATAYSNYGDVETAEDFFREAIDIAQSKQNIKLMAIQRSDYGRLLAVTDRPVKALTELKQAQKDNEEAGLDLQSAIIVAHIGLAYVMKNDYQTACEHYQFALSRFAKMDAPQWEARIHANRGDSALKICDLAQADEHYQRAYSLARTHELVDILVQATIAQAQIAIQSNDLETANRKLSEIEPITIRLNYRRLLANLHQAWSQYHAKQGHTDKATSAWEKAKKIRRIMQMSVVSPDWL